MKIKVVGRLLFKVESRSRPGEHHTVDLEPQDDGRRYACDCERFTKNTHFHGNPCPHIAAAVSFVLENRAPAAGDVHLPEKQPDEQYQHDAEQDGQDPGGSGRGLRGPGAIEAFEGE